MRQELKSEVNSDLERRVYKTFDDFVSANIYHEFFGKNSEVLRGYQHYHDLYCVDLVSRGELDQELIDSVPGEENYKRFLKEALDLGYLDFLSSQDKYNRLMQQLAEAHDTIGIDPLDSNQSFRINSLLRFTLKA